MSLLSSSPSWPSLPSLPSLRRSLSASAFMRRRLAGGMYLPVGLIGSALGFGRGARLARLPPGLGVAIGAAPASRPWAASSCASAICQPPPEARGSVGRAAGLSVSWLESSASGFCPNCRLSFGPRPSSPRLKAENFAGLGSDSTFFRGTGTGGVASRGARDCSSGGRSSTRPQRRLRSALL
eukprot:scaffold2331_cov252-Pinguiococcus_pyrenoidosus.AAC.15